MNNFEKSGYGTLNIGIGERCALLIVDFQRGFTDPNSQMGQSKHIQNAVNKTVELVDFAHQNIFSISSCRVSWAGPAVMAYWIVVCYTHLTLPTIDYVENCVVAAALTNKNNV